jgi:hypothetical protein
VGGKKGQFNVVRRRIRGKNAKEMTVVDKVPPVVRKSVRFHMERWVQNRTDIRTTGGMIGCRRLMNEACPFILFG